VPCNESRQKCKSDRYDGAASLEDSRAALRGRLLARRDLHSLNPGPAKIRTPASRAANSIKARYWTIMRCGAIAEVEHRLVNVTPAPAFGRVIAFDDRMTCRMNVCHGVAAG